jgi:hypothetical protein
MVGIACLYAIVKQKRPALPFLLSRGLRDQNAADMTCLVNALVMTDDRFFPGLVTASTWHSWHGNR